MDFLQLVLEYLPGVISAVVGAITVVGLLEGLKKLDKSKLVHKIRGHVPIAVIFSFLTMVTAALAKFILWKEVPFYGLLTFAFAKLGYDQIIKRFKKDDEK